ncbi:MAG: hypothetical protein ACE5PO_04220 [Candidatus Bathyarchaeia archaeon]
MGRTVPSYRLTLEDEITSWKGFRDALRAAERELFDDMMQMCRSYASASGAAVRPIPSEALFMVLLLYHHKLLRNRQKSEQNAPKTLEDG